MKFFFTYLLPVFLFSVLMVSMAWSQSIHTVAGTGAGDFSGDGGAATAAQLQPVGVALDREGNLFVADGANHRIRKIDASGRISTIAGTGTKGNSGEGGEATAAQLHFPTAVAVDGAGNLFIADSYNHRICKVDERGVITTVAGTGTEGYSGDGGPATAAMLNQPYGIAVGDGGNIYISDSFNFRVRKVDGSGTITTVAGNGLLGYNGDDREAVFARLGFPVGLVVDENGNLFIAESNTHRVRKVDASGIISTVAGTGIEGDEGEGGEAKAARLHEPTDLALDEAGNLYIADASNHRILKVDAAGRISTVAGSGTEGFGGDDGLATAAQMNRPISLAIDASADLFIVDQGNYRLRKVDGNRVAFDQSLLNSGSDLSAVSFTFSSVTAGDAFEYEISSDGGDEMVTGSGSIHQPDEQVRGIDVRNLKDGTLKLSVTLTDEAGNVKSLLAATTTKDVTAPTFRCPSDVDFQTQDPFPSIALMEVNDQLGTPKISYELSGATTASGIGDAGQETFNPGETTVKYTVSDGNGNSNVCSFLLNYGEPLGLYDETFGKLRVYPNPADKEVVTVDFGDAYGQVQIVLLDIAGREAYQQQLKVPAQKISLPVSGLANGIYLLKLEGPFGQKVLRLLVE